MLTANQKLGGGGLAQGPPDPCGHPCIAGSAGEVVMPLRMTNAEQ